MLPVAAVVAEQEMDDSINPGLNDPATSIAPGLLILCSTPNAIVGFALADADTLMFDLPDTI